MDGLISNQKKSSNAIHWHRAIFGEPFIKQEWWIRRSESVDPESECFETARNVILTEQEKAGLEKEIAALLKENMTGDSIYFSLRDSFKLPRRKGLFMSMKPFLSIVKKVRVDFGFKGKHAIIRESKTKQIVKMWDSGNKNIYSIAGKVGTDYFTARTALIRHKRIVRKMDR